MGGKEADNRCGMMPRFCYWVASHILDAMGFRLSRQLAILAVAAIIAGGVGFLILRSGLPEPSCMDNRLNQGEERIDCGGPCDACVLRESKPIEIFWTRFVKVRENTYDVAAEIRNPNVKLAASYFDYEFKLYDSAGVNVVSRRGRSFMYPGETAHLAEIGLLSNHAIRSASLTIGDTAWASSDAVKPDVFAGSKEYAVEGEPGRTVSVAKTIVLNRELFSISDIGITAIVFDGNGNLLGAHRTIIKSLGAGASQPVVLAWPAVFPVPVASFLIEVHTSSAIQTRP